MHQKIGFHSGAARIAVTGVWGILCVMIFAAPVLSMNGFPIAATAIYVFFSRICHQSPMRVFTIRGYPLAVCHRCSGIYLGFFLGSFIRIPRMYRSPRTRRYWVLAAIVPVVSDTLAPFCGIWTNTCGSRFLTGLFFGIVTSSLLAQGIEEFFAEIPWRRFLPGGSNLRGGPL